MSEVPSRRRVALLFLLAGLLVAAAVYRVLGAEPGFDALLTCPAAWEWMLAGAAAGLLLRTARRKLIIAGRASYHSCFAFECLFQGGIFVHPQLPYPDTEREFLAVHTHAPPGSLAAWFQIRETSALALPLLLAAVVFLLAGGVAPALALAAASLGWQALRALRNQQAESRPRVLFASLAGSAAAAAEGLCFVAAASALQPGAVAWKSFLLYSALLAAFELTPIPLALGSLEVTHLFVVALAGPAVPGLLMSALYRLVRGGIVTGLLFFYLPRYKMAPADLFAPGLPGALARLRGGFESAAADSGLLLSVVIPAYNEAERLPRYLPDVIAYCSALPGGAEVLVVDDGSRDGTAAYVESVSALYPFVRLVRQGTNQGKGAAVRRGVAEAAGRFILFADADGATPIAEAAKLLQSAAQGADVVIGSRALRGDGVRQERSWIRELVGSAFYRITNLLAVPGVGDTQCGFKLFRREAAALIFPLLVEKGWAFDVEILFLAQKSGMRIAEVAVNWAAVEGSKVSPRDAFRMFAALLRIRNRGAGLMRRPPDRRPSVSAGKDAPGAS